MARNKGWEFLFKEGKEWGSFYDDEGNEGYIYSDGSGSFRGADGSDGYIYSDGSGYFHGADGSDGYKYSDGSGYFRGGAKNVDAYQYSDGSGYYEDDDCSREYYDSVDDLEELTEDSGAGSGSAGVGATILATGIIGAAAVAGSVFGKKRRHAYDDDDLCEDEEDDDDEEVYVAPKRTQKRKKSSGSKDANFMLLACVIIFIIIALIISWPFSDIRKDKAEAAGKISAGYYGDLVGEDYEVVEAHFRAAGFTNIELIDLDDAGLAFWRDGKVDMISVGGDTDFDSTDYFYPDTKVIISYH